MYISKIHVVYLFKINDLISIFGLEKVSNKTEKLCFLIKILMLCP